MKSNEIAHSGSEPDEPDSDDDEVEYYVDNSIPSWTQIGLGLLGAFLGVTAATAGSRHPLEQDEEVVDINQPINLEHTNPVAIQGCVLEEDIKGHVFLRYKCQYCGWVSSRQHEVHRARIGGTKTGGVFNCGNRCPQQPYEILHSG
jgi:hypothetical protein